MVTIVVGNSLVTPIRFGVRSLGYSLFVREIFTNMKICTNLNIFTLFSLFNGNFIFPKVPQKKIKG